MNTPLLGARIWLSGSVPEDDCSTTEQREAIKNFVRLFSRTVFRHGGHIIHGSHPSITPILLDESVNYRNESGRKDALILTISRHWSKDMSSVLDSWRNASIVYETPAASEGNCRDESLSILRKWMAARCDAVVVVGGKCWANVADRAGCPIEIDLAIKYGLPCFILGGFGGATRNLIDNYPELFDRLKNGLDRCQNHNLATMENVDSVAEQVCTYLERLPLVRGRGDEGVSFRILALDGGGVKGAFTAAVLAAWENHTGMRIVDHFDLIAGTSTGGILAIGLGMGLTAKEMLDFYKDRGPVIFPITRLHGKIWRTLKNIILPKYSQDVLFNEIKCAYSKNGKNKILSDSKCRLVIPAFNTVAGASHIFRTPHNSDINCSGDLDPALVALATAAAPTYFSAAKIQNIISESSYIDGGVWANSPVMAAVIESVCFLRTPLERIDILSIGTTEEPFTVQRQGTAGLLGWVIKKRILELLMNVQQESSLTLSKNLVGAPRFLRINKITPHGSYLLDSAEEINNLASLGESEAMKPEIICQVKSRFLNGISTTDWKLNSFFYK